MSPLVTTERSRFAREVAAEVVVPIFAGSGERAAAVLKVQRVTRDLQKRGFFRIGSLPCVRFEGVVLEVRDQEVLTEAIASVPSNLRRAYRKGVFEVKDFTLVLGGPARVEIRAGNVNLNERGQWRLDGVRVSGAAQVEAADWGALHLEGEKRGVLVLSTSDGQTEINLERCSKSKD